MHLFALNASCCWHKTATRAINTLNPPGYCGRGSGYKRASSLHGKQHQPGHSAPCQRQHFSQGADSGYRQRLLSQRAPQHYLGPGRARAPEQDYLDKAFSLLRTNPGQALDAAEVLLDKYSAHPFPCIPVFLVKARALFQLGKIDDCIAFINSLETSLQHDKGLLMAKGRALQSSGCFHEALPLFQHLYVKHQATYKDHKAHGLALGRLLECMGGAADLEKALTIFTRLRTRAAAGRAHSPCDDKDIELTLGRLLQMMGGAANMEKALAIFTRLRTRAAGERPGTPCNDKEIELTLGRHLQLMGGAANMEKALTIYSRLRTRAAGGQKNTPCDDKDIELAWGKVLVKMGGPDNLEKALAIFTRLRRRAAAGRADTPCDDKDIELALGRHFQLMGGADNLEKALAIFTRLRARAAGGQDNTPCNDKDIELAWGKVREKMGGPDNLEKALVTFTRLRRRAAAGRADTPCDDKDIELALGRTLQLMGGADNLEKTLAIFTRLRARAAGGQDNSPCDDKDIELALGAVFEIMPGPDNLAKALAIFTRLRTRAAGGRANTPCNDKEIELALATLFVEEQNWPAFDALRLEVHHFSGFEPHLCLSVRYLRELLETEGASPAHSRLLGKAILSAVIAMEKSGFMNASCISQLAHCIRLLSCWPDAQLSKRGIHHKDARRLRTAATFLFNAADRISPSRQRRDKDQRWRVKEQELRALLSRQHSARSLQYQLTH